MTKQPDIPVSFRMDPRLHSVAKAAHRRFNEQHFGQIEGMSFNTFLEIAIGEWLSQQCPDLYAVGFGKEQR